MTYYAWLVKSELWRPVVKAETIRRGKHKGQYRVTLGNGRVKIASKVIERKG